MVEKVYQNVLVLSDDSSLVRVALELLAGNGVRGTAARDVKIARKRLESRRWDMVLMDLSSGQEEVFDLLRGVKESFPEMPVVMIGEDGSAGAAMRAMREGCRDFLVKPVARPALRDVLESLLPNHDVPLAAAAHEDSQCIYQIAGRSRKLLETVRLAAKVAPTSIPVLVGGESGTGKELISYLLHHRSNRSRGPYIRVNCAALSESLLESELFGHEKGAFTGAYTQRKGKFERAHGGTLLLDEISETSPRLQAELLRVLEQQDFERVGGSESVRVNVRIVATSNRDLVADVERGKFRSDLFYRIGGVRLTVPPLRQRKEDIPVLVWHFVNIYSREVRRHVTDIDKEMLEGLMQYHWPGNVRQLRNVVRNALVLGEGPVLSLKGAPSLAEELRAAPAGESADAASLSLRDVERKAILEALRRTKKNQVKAAHLLGITDRTLREKLRRYHRDGNLQPAGESRW